MNPHARPDNAPRRRRDLALLASVASVGLLLVLTTAKADASRSFVARGGRAVITLSALSIKSNRFTVAGRVHVRGSGSALRSARLVATLSGPQIARERYSSRIINSRFRITSHPKLAGAVKLTLAVNARPHRLRAVVTRVVHIPPPPVEEPAKEEGGTSIGNGKLSGTFELTGATESGGKVSGSYFEMFDPGGTVPLPNGNSTLASGDYTALPPGTDLGLKTGAYQSAPSPPFDKGSLGNSLAAAIIAPQNFFGFNFGIVTEATDPQAGVADPLPDIVNTEGTLSGQLTAWSVGWNGQWFNQGTPKPGGELPAGTTALSGSIDPKSGLFALEWRSIIKGGPFNGFDGYWHLEGVFVPAP